MSERTPCGYITVSGWCKAHQQWLNDPAHDPNGADPRTPAERAADQVAEAALEDWIDAAVDGEGLDQGWREIGSNPDAGRAPERQPERLREEQA